MAAAPQGNTINFLLYISSTVGANEVSLKFRL